MPAVALPRGAGIRRGGGPGACAGRPGGVVLGRGVIWGFRAHWGAGAGLWGAGAPRVVRGGVGGREKQRGAGGGWRGDIKTSSKRAKLTVWGAPYDVNLPRAMRSVN